MRNPKIEVKIIKHNLTVEERRQMGEDLVLALGTKDTTEKEFDNVKATWKAKVTEVEAHIGLLATTLRAGFDMRQTRCAVVYRPKERKKDYFFEGRVNGTPVLTEDMTEADFQAELPAIEEKAE